MRRARRNGAYRRWPAFAGHVGIVRDLLSRGARISDDLINSVAMKVSILAENAENEMVRPEAVEAWRGFLDGLIAERQKQDVDGGGQT